MTSNDEDITVLLRKWADVIHIASGNHVNVDLRFAAKEIERLRAGMKVIASEDGCDTLSAARQAAKLALTPTPT